MIIIIWNKIKYGIESSYKICDWVLNIHYFWHNISLDCSCTRAWIYKRYKILILRKFLGHLPCIQGWHIRNWLHAANFFIIRVTRKVILNKNICFRKYYNPASRSVLTSNVLGATNWKNLTWMSMIDYKCRPFGTENRGNGLRNHFKNI